MNKYKEELLNMYIDAATEAYDCWESEFCCSNTERKKEEQKLNNNIEKFKKLLENA